MTPRNNAPPAAQEVSAPVDRLGEATDSTRETKPAVNGLPQPPDSGAQTVQSRVGTAESRRMSAEGCWVPPGGSARVAGHDIGDMVYVGQGLMNQSGRRVENCLIDPTLPVATRIVRDATDAAYSPSYSQLSPSDRLGYLRWLASERTDPNVAPPFLRLYFFGLERRLMLDETPDEERAALIAEIERLHSIYEDDYGLEEDIRYLLDCAAALTPERIEPDPGCMVDFDHHQLPPWLVAGLGYQVAQGKIESGDWLLCWWLAQPGTRLRVAQRRIFDAFATLFPVRFAKRYPDGLKVAVPNATSDLTYVAASCTFDRSLTRDSNPYPEISRIRQPLRIARRIADECWRDLASYSRFVGRVPSKSDRIEAHVLLPTDLAVRRPNADLKRLHEWARQHVDRLEDQVSVSEVLRVFEGGNRVSVRKQRLVILSNALALGGIGLAPDTRFTGRLPKLEDRAVLFRLPGEASKPPEMSPRYLRMLYVMQLVVYVARAGGSVSKAKWRAMDAMIERRPRLRAADKKRLRADLRWLATKRQGGVSIKKRCQMLRPKELDEACELAVKVACADGVVDPAQVRAVEKLYHGVGRPKDTVFANLHSRSAKVRMRPVPAGRPRRPRSSLFPPRRDGHFRARTPRPVALDDGRISKIVADTRKVSRILSEVFVEEEPATVPAAAGIPGSAAGRAAFEGLDAAHSALVERLVKRRTWSETDFERLVKRCGLMAGGALEAVNEWAFERFGDALVEEDASLTLNPDVLEALSDPSGGVPDAAA